MKREDIEKAARIANGTSRACAKCYIKEIYKICPFECQKVCSSAFVEGFKKGVKWVKQQKEGE